MRNAYVTAFMRAALVAACVLAPGAARAADRVTASDNGYGRILFTLTPAAEAKPALTSGVLTIAFARRIGVDPATIAQSLAAYVASARVDGDGKTFRFALKQAARLHVSRSANQIAIDLVPQSFAGTPPELPPPPPKAVAAVDVNALPALGVRAGSYAAFTRLVFDWPKSVPYSVFPGAGRITLRFEAQARPDLGVLTRNAPAWVKKAGWRIENKGTIVELDTDADAGFHHFRDGTHVVLDVLAPKTDAGVYAPPQDNGKPGPKTQFTKLSQVAGTSLSPAQAKAIADAAAATQPVKAPDVKAPDAKAKQPDMPKAQDGQKSETPVPPPAEIAQAADPDAPEAQRTRSGAVLVFPGAGNRAVAAFVRGMTAWVVFDGAVKIDPVPLKAALGDYPQSFDVSNGSGATILRIGLKRAADISARAEGRNLKITLAPSGDTQTLALGFTRSDLGPKRAALASVAPGATRPLFLADPEAGDTLIVIPARTGRGVLEPRRYLELAVLPSAAGLALTPFSDNLDVRVADSRITITSATGLDVTPASLPQAETPAALARNGDGPAYLNFEAWAKASGGDFLAAQARLRAAIASLKADEANSARLTLARFYLANGFAAEALGLVNLIQASDPALQSDAQLLTMRAAADYIMGRYLDARNTLAGTQFDQDRHANFWRGLSEAALENWGAARTALEKAEPVLRRYPADWQARARIAQARTALAAGALEGADSALAKLPRDLPKPLMLDTQLVRAKLYAQEGRIADADKLYASVESGGDERAAAIAVYERTIAGLGAGSISKAKAIAALEALRFRWRGDALELKTLRKLGDLYFADKRWREGLHILRVASDNFGNDDYARKAQDDMRRAFEDLFLKGKADQMKPVDALALFYDFIELTPIGPNGDEMIRRMADRLVAVDLLTPAANLLNYQVTKRLDGIARAQVATRLAMIQLLDAKPKDALATLRSTRIAGLPDDINHQRQLLEARALAALRQWDLALELIAVDDAPDTRRLRADIYWESGNWAVSAAKFEELLGERWQDAKTLAPDERRDVMRAAISYSLANDQAGLDRLAQHFGAKMKTSPDAPAFAVVTEAIDTQGAAFRDMAARIASVDTFRTFMKNFRKRYDVAATN